MRTAVERRLAQLPAPRVLVLSGGGGNGASQAAALLELYRGGLKPDLIVGTSIGAWNGAYLALHPGIEGAEKLVELWKEGALFQMANPRLGRLIAAATFQRPTLISPASINRALARTGLNRASWSGLKVPFVLGAINAADFQLQYWDAANAASTLGAHVSACSALAPLLPFGQIQGGQYVDAGMQDNYGLPEAVRRLKASGAQSATLLVLDCAPSVPRGPVANPARATDVALGATFRRHRDDGVALARAAGYQVEIIEVGGDHPISDYSNPSVGIGVGSEAVQAWAVGREFYPHWPNTSLLRRVANVAGFIVKDCQARISPGKAVESRQADL